MSSPELEPPRAFASAAALVCRDIILLTFEHLSVPDLARASCVCREWNSVARLAVKYSVQVKAYLYHQWGRILSGKISLRDFMFAKEVGLVTYSTRQSASLPPAAIVATKAMRKDPMAEPRYGERIPYIVVHGEPGSRLVDMVINPMEVLRIDSPLRLNELYYISKQIIPSLQRVFGLVGAYLNRWFAEMPRPMREIVKKHSFSSPNAKRTRIDYYYLSNHCIICGDLVPSSVHICSKCSCNSSAVASYVIGKTSRLEGEMQHLADICRHCGGGNWILESGVKCTSLLSLCFTRD